MVQKNGMLALGLVATVVLTVAQFIAINQIVSLVCLVVLFIAIGSQFFTQGNAPKEESNSESSSMGSGEATVELKAALDQVSETLVHDAVVVNQEILRVDGLIKEAVALMGSSFHDMHDLANRQIELTSEIISQSQGQRF